MHSKSKQVWTKWILSVVELLALLPILLMVGIFLISTHLWGWLALLSGAYFSGILLRTFWPGQKRWVYIALGLIASGGVSVWMMTDIVSTVLTGGIGFILIYRGFLYVERAWDEVLPIQYLWIDILIYFIAYFFYRFTDSLLPYLPVMTWAGIAVVVLTLFRTNSGHLRAVTLSGDKKPFLSHALRLQNRLYILGTLIVVVLIVNFNVLQAALSRLVEMIYYWVVWFFSLFSNSEEIVDEGSPGMVDPPPLPEGGEPSWFAQLMERILMVVVYIALAIAAVLLLYYFSKKMRVWIARCFHWLLNKLNQILGVGDDQREDSSGYIDEKETLMDWKEVRKNYEDRFKEWMSNLFTREPRWSDLQNNKERVRYLYRHFILNRVRKGYTYKEYYTPQETAAEVIRTNKSDNEDQSINELTQLYNDVRYGEKEIDDEQVSRIHHFKKE